MFAFGLGLQEILIVCIIGAVLFGGKGLPGLAKSVGKGLQEFRKGLNGIEDEPDTTPAVTSQSAPRPPQRIPAAPTFEDGKR
jgi:sec-independent protein translocase protein TatA